MDGKLFSIALFFLSKILLLRKTGNPLTLHRKLSKSSYATQQKFNKENCLSHVSEKCSDQALMFHVEGALLRSTSLFPYFMLVAFEAGGPLRSLILLLMYPFVCLLGKKIGLMIMVFVCFFGVKEESFRVGRAVLPKFFLEEVGYEGFNVVMSYARKVGVSDLPRVMVDGFLKDYLGVEDVVGRELKVIYGYFVGLMEAKNRGTAILHEVLGEEKRSSHISGFSCFNKSQNEKLFSHCKEIYMVSEAEKKNWKVLPREKYPKPLIFHDGRLAFKPTPLASLTMFLWIPFGFVLFIIRSTVGLFLPYKLIVPIMAFTGMKSTLSRPKSYTTSFRSEEKSRGILYVCNHRTLLDPIYISFAILKPLTAVTYSLSRFSELFSPINTVRLTRDREKDSKKMDELLSQGDLVVCPEGTTCREPFLLRFSPLFAEMSDQIVPVAIDTQVSMFYGTTASGVKWFDPIFFLMNPHVNYSVKILEKLPGRYTCGAGGKSKFEVANHVQTQIAKALGFECTGLTRKDKYMILAGNEGTMWKTSTTRERLERIIRQSENIYTFQE